MFVHLFKYMQPTFLFAEFTVRNANPILHSGWCARGEGVWMNVQGHIGAGAEIMENGSDGMPI